MAYMYNKTVIKLRLCAAKATLCQLDPRSLDNLGEIEY